MRILVFLFGVHALAFGQESSVRKWTPALPMCGAASLSSVRDLQIPAASEYEIVRTFRGGWCSTDVRVKPGMVVSPERGEAILEQVIPTFKRGEFQAETLTREGCLAFREQTYKTIVVEQTLNYCGEGGTKRFESATIAMRVAWPEAANSPQRFF